MPENYGSKQVLTGRRCGTTYWIAQRASGFLMALFLVLLLGRSSMASEGGRWAWVRALEPQWMRLLAFTTLLGLMSHAWIGMRDVLMDYVKPLALRLVLEVAVIVWLLGCTGWAIRVLWKI